MPKARVRDMDIDEVSMVDRPANQYGDIVLAKRADLEDEMPDQFTVTGEDGQDYDLGDAKPGQFTDEDGNTYEWDGENLYQLAEDAEDADAEEPQLQPVGKSAFLRDDSAIVARVSAELSKAVSDADRNEVVSKAFTELEKRAAAAEQRAARAEALAKAAEDRRLTDEYIKRAGEYNVPIDPAELGPVLKRMAETLSDADCSVINKALTASGEIFTEIGVDNAGPDPDDPAAQLDAYLDGEVAKSANSSPVSKAQAMTDYFDANPDAYDAYRAERIR